MLSVRIAAAPNKRPRRFARGPCLLLRLLKGSLPLDPVIVVARLASFGYLTERHLDGALVVRLRRARELGRFGLELVGQLLELGLVFVDLGLGVVVLYVGRAGLEAVPWHMRQDLKVASITRYDCRVVRSLALDH